MEPHRNPLNKLAHRLAVPTYPPPPPPPWQRSVDSAISSHLFSYSFLVRVQLVLLFFTPRTHACRGDIQPISSAPFQLLFFLLAQSPVLLQLRGMYLFSFLFLDFTLSIWFFFFFETSSVNQELSRLLVPLESYVCTIYLPVPRNLSSVSTRPLAPL
jgi:hypothetical protein